MNPEFRHGYGSREPQPFAQGFYYDVYRMTDPRGAPIDTVAKVFTMRDRDPRSVPWDTFTRAIETDHAFCVTHFAEFVPQTTFVRTPSADVNKLYDFMALQENLERAVAMKEYLASRGDGKLDAVVYERIMTLLDRLQTTLDREGKIPEVLDLLGEKRDVVIDPSTGRVLLLDTNNVVYRGTDHEFLRWQMELGSNPELKQKIDNRTRFMRRLAAIRKEVEKYKPLLSPLG